MVSLLKNKFLLLFACLAFVLLMAQCGETGKKPDSVSQYDTGSCKKKAVNPNGDSELALLMREMLSSADSMKTSIKEGRIPEKFPEAFLNIHTAKPTDEETKHASYDAFATNYIDNLQLLCRSPKAEVVRNYNAVINSCLGCHSEHCPGPIKTIEKLFLKE